MNTDVNPCPFCGSESRLSAYNDGPTHYACAAIECGKCPARMTHDTYTMPGAKLSDLIDAVVANWNRRAEPKPEEGNAQ